jgi:hypothetical protein
MNIREIEKLIDRYYSGETSLQEEEVLRKFFCGSNVPDHLLKHVPVFVWMKEQSDFTIEDPSFEKKLMAKLMATDHTEYRQKPWLKSRTFSSVLLAACVTLLIGILTVLQFREKDFNSAIQKQDAAVIYAQTTMILGFVSHNFNTGLQELVKVGEFERATHNLEQFHKFYQSQSSIINTDELYGSSTNQLKP